MTPQHQTESRVGARFSASPFRTASPAVAQLYPEPRRDAAPHLGLIFRIKPLPICGRLLLVVALGTSSVLGDCKCGPVRDEETTHWGGHESAIFVEKNSYRQLRGSVQRGSGQTSLVVLVEVFDHPDYLLERSSNVRENHPEQKRVAACRTSADGKFCFPNLPSGKYELRTSINGEWNTSHVYVVVDKKAGQQKSLRVLMELGT
jgi:hypothetical protein